MKDILVPIDKAGRVVLPKNVREELAIEPGDMLKVTIRGNEVMLQPKKDTSGFVRRGKALIFSSGRDDLLKPEMVEGILAEEREGRGVEMGAAFLPANQDNEGLF
jgi:AbrB family looped-hinge helix DNA binding protein